MKLSATLAIGATIAAAAMFAACGGGSDAANDSTGKSSSNITTQHGLSVAALYGNNGISNVGGDLPAAAPVAAEANSSNTSAGSAPADSARSASSGNSAAGVAGAPQQAAGGTNGITVSGFGLATADPDTAIIDLYFNRYSYCCNDVVPVPEPALPPDANGSSGSAPGIDVKPPVPSTGTVEPITEADLQPVIDALVGAGVARGDIEFTGQTYFDQYSSNATLHVTVKNFDSVQSVLSAAQTASANIANTSMSSNVSYTLNDCSAIEKAALDAAVTDAGERGQQLADALHVSKGKVIGASDFSWSPSGSQCSSYGMPYPVYYDKSTISANGSATPGAGQVQVVAQISVTYELN